MVDSPQIVQLGFQAPIPAFPQRGGGPPWILIRVGDWRVIYSIDDRRRVVDVLYVPHRGEAYERP